jgi:hypothetical protein
MDNKSGAALFFAVVGAIFVLLKGIGYITASWWLVLVPVWGPVFVIMATLIIISAFGLLTGFIGSLFGGDGDVDG